MSNVQHITASTPGPYRRNHLGQWAPDPSRVHESSRVNGNKLKAKLAALTKLYDPSGTLPLLDKDRLKIAAKLLILAERTSNPTDAVRCVHASERLLRSIKRPPDPEPSVWNLEPARRRRKRSVAP